MPRTRDGEVYRTVRVRMWKGGSFTRLSAPPPCGQFLFLYLITGDMTCALPGVVMGGHAAIAEVLGWELEPFREAFREVLREGMAVDDPEGRLMWCRNGLMYNPPQSPNACKAWGKAFAELNDCSLKVTIYQEVKAFLEGYGKAFLEAFVHAVNSKQNRYLYEEYGDDAHANENGQAHESDLAKVHEFQGLWNSKVGKKLPNCRPLSTSSQRGRDLIAATLARLDEHPESSEWGTVIDNILAREYCLGDNDSGWMADFQFLVRAGTFEDHFDGKFSSVKKLKAKRKRKTTSEPPVKDELEEDFDNAILYFGSAILPRLVEVADRAEAEGESKGVATVVRMTIKATQQAMDKAKNAADFTARVIELEAEMFSGIRTCLDIKTGPNTNLAVIDKEIRERFKIPRLN